MSSPACAARLHWTGSTGSGVRGYPRDHVAVAPPAATEVPLSADPAFHGSDERLNPEQLLVMAASSCQMLSFLAAAARTGVDVPAYDDEAAARLGLAARPARLGAIRLSVTVAVAVAPGTDAEQVRRLAEQAHHACHIANSLAVPVELTTTVVG